MDVRSWRKILLQWITECNFMEHNYFNIEQTNIDGFYRNFRLKHKVAGEFDTLRSFLATHYPEFLPNVDDENALSAADYIYVYSLLLHFCCVKCPDEHFHGICKKLSEQTQQCIAAFFKHLLDCPNIDKEHLRHAIAEVVATYMSSPPPAQQNKSESISSNTTASSTGAISVELQTSFSSSPSRGNGDSPLRTPNRKVIPVVQRVSPGTPKSFLLEERTRELYNYKAQLETERYEKGLLELQILQNEQQIQTLTQVQKKLQQKIQALKDEVLNQSVEPNRNEDEDDQLQRRLYRQINDREDEIFILNEKIRSLGDEKTLLENKMRHADKKLVDYRETINELELQLTELTTQLEKKESAIKCLTDDKAELEHFIAESRTASRNSHPNFNSSTDCLDSSFSRYTNSSSSLGSPENLGSSVVDVQLREKEHENTQLRQELAEMRANNKKLQIYIKEKTHLYQKEFNFEVINASVVEDEEDTVAEFNILVDCMDHLSQSYQAAKELIQRLEADVNTLQEKNSELTTRFDNSMQEIGRLTLCLNKAESANEAHKQELEKLERLNNELKHNYEIGLKESETNITQLNSYVEGLNEKIRLQTRKIESLDVLSSKLQAEKAELEKKYGELQMQQQRCYLENRTLQETIGLQNSKLQTHIDTELSLKQRFEQLLIQNEEVLQNSRQTDSHLQSMRADINQKETDLSKLGREIVQLGKSNSELEDRIEKLLNKFKEKKIRHDTEILELQKSLANTENKLDQKCNHLEDLISQIEVVFKAIEGKYPVFQHRIDCSPAEHLKELKEITFELLRVKEESLQKIHQLESNNKRGLEKLHSVEDQLRAEIERNEVILRQHKAEIEAINENCSKAEMRIEELEAMIKEMNESHHEEILTERTKWQSKQEQLQAELMGEKEVCAAKEVELELHFDKLVETKQLLEVYESQLNELQASQKEAQYNYKETIIAFEAKIQSLDKENGELVDELTLLREKYDKTKQNLKTAEHEIENLQKTIGITETEHEEEITTFSRNIKSISAEKKELESALKNQQEAIASKSRELITSNEFHKKTLEQLRAAKVQMTELTENIKSAQNDYVILQQDLCSKIQKLIKHNAELQTNKQQIEEKLEAETELRLVQQQEVKTLEDRLKELQQTYANAEEDFEEKKTTLEETIKVLSEQNEQFTTEIEKLQDNNDVNEQRLLKTDENLKQLTIELEKTTAMVNERNIKIEESQHMLTVASEKLEEKTKIWENMQLTCQKQSEELDELRKKTTQLQELSQKQCSELELLQSTVNKQSKELLVAQDEIDNLKKADRTKQLEVEKLQLDLKQADSKYNERNKMLDERVDEVMSLAQKLEVLQKDHDKLKAELEQVSKKKAELSQEVLELKALLEKKDQHVEELRALHEETTTDLKSVTDECTKLQSEIVAKEAEVRMINDELQQVQADGKIQLEKALGIVRDNEEAATGMLNLIENSLMISNITNNDSNTTLIPSKAGDTSTLVQLKEVVNIIIATINQQKSTLKELPELQYRLNELNEQHTKSLANCNILKSQLKSAEQKIGELEDQKRLLKRKVANEHAHFTSDIRSLEQVNEKLGGENETLLMKISNKERDLETMQVKCGMLKAVNDRLTKAQESIEVEYIKTIDALKSEQQRMREVLEEKAKVFENLQQQHNELQRCSAEKEATLKNNIETVQLDVRHLTAEKSSLSQELLAKKEECTALTSKCDELECKNTELNTKAAEFEKECITLRAELVALNEKCERAKEELTANSSQLEVANANCTSYREELNELVMKNQQLNRNFKDVEEKLSTSNSELEALIQQKDSLLKEKEKLSEELNAMKRECRDLKQTTHNLSQKLALTDLEKDDLRRQLELLRTQVEVNSKYQTTSETKLKDIVETSQALERNLLSSENALKTTRATLDQFKLNTEKMSTENKKLRDNFEALNKRVEKMALKLGEALARSDKLERENEKLVKASEAQATTIETAQREKEVHQLECKTLKERFSRVERLNEQYVARVQTSEKSNTTLIAAKQKLEAAEVDLKTKIAKLENSRQILEERLRKMTHNYERCERENVTLNHQIGALNTEIQMLKNAANEFRNAKLDEMSKNLNEANARSKEAEELNKKLSVECGDLQQQNHCLTDQLSKVVLALEISKTKCDQLGTEVQQLENELKKLHQEKISMDQAHGNILEQVEKHKSLYEKMLSDKRELELKVLANDDEMLTKDAEIAAMRKEIAEIRQNALDNSESLADKANNLVAEVENLRTRLLAGEAILEKEQENNGKLRSDNQILLAKYREAKQRAETEVTSSEERIKENRLELEGKLEKMKNKMKVLYTEEVTKMKAKQDRETGNMRSELSILKAQNAKFEEHTRKLSAELMMLNDRMLEYQKENAYLLTKLKYARNEDTQFKRPSSTNAHTSTSTLPRLSNLQNIPTNIGTDLAMEDEEGELFNNTYLTDMKNGRMSEICPEELQHRNSLLPPHLKSAYAVQYDHGLCEDEVKDGAPNGFDDSMSALLSNNSNCIRKKIIGVTHYRKPGPPTPSKNGGRLSFGGSSEPSREVLKDSYDDNTSSVKTPARFGFFTSRFSMGNSNTTRDEYEVQQQEQQQQELLHTRMPEINTDKHDLRRALQRKNIEKLNQASVIEQDAFAIKILTSTPRKSRGRSIDKRRLINEILKASVPIAETSTSSHEITPPDISNIETPTLSTEGTRRQSACFAKSNKSKQVSSRTLNKTRTASTGSSTGAMITALQRRIRRRPRREQGARPSLCVQKNLYTNKAFTPHLSALRDLKRMMGRRQRMLRFDKQRMLVNTSSSTAENSDADLQESAESEETCGKTITVVDNATFDVNNTNHYQTKVIVKNNIEEFEKSSSVWYEQHDVDDNCEHMENSSGVDVHSNAMNSSSNKIIASSSSTDAATKIFTTVGLHEFTQQLENMQAEIYTENDTSSARFEKLLKQTVSHAPFEVRNMRLSSLGASRDQQSNRDSNTESFTSNTGILANSKKSISDSPSTTVAAATPHQPTLSPSSMLQHSRTIYGASVIFNHRIPNVDGLRVRKSSIYFKNPKCSTFRSSCGLSTIDSNGVNTAGFSQEGDLILVTNQTITLYDLICMWRQMNVWTRIVISVMLLGSISAIAALLYIFCFNR